MPSNDTVSLSALNHEFNVAVYVPLDLLLHQVLKTHLQCFSLNFRLSPYELSTIF